MSWSRFFVIVLSVGVGATCSDDPSGVEPVIDCGPEVTSVRVTVSQGLTPSIDWAPRCRVALLLIEEGAHDTWSLSGDEDQNDVGPPVTYGVAPPGLRGGILEPLLAGHTYEVILWHVGNQSERILAIHEFTR
jgi:hypothetical protein